MQSDLNNLRNDKLYLLVIGRNGLLSRFQKSSLKNSLFRDYQSDIVTKGEYETQLKPEG